MRKFWWLVAMVALLAPLAFAQQTPESKPPAAAGAERPPSTYRRDFNVYELTDGKKTNTRSYSLVLQDNREYNRIRAGLRMPVVTGSAQGGPPTTSYIDIGWSINCRLLPHGDAPVLEATTDLNNLSEEHSPTGNPVMRSIGSSTTAAITPGKPLMLSSIDDVITNRRFQVEVTATKLP